MEPKLAASKSNPISEIAVNGEEDESKQNHQIQGRSTVLYQGFYCPSWLFPNIKSFQREFQPQDTDMIIATKPKSGTTWLKALVYSIVHRTHFSDFTDHPVLTKNPHTLVHNFEFDLYKQDKSGDNLMTSLIAPRILSTHLPYVALPESVKGRSKCKIVCLARNPFDTVVSSWKFATQLFPEVIEKVSFEDFVESFCRGEDFLFGPHWDHVLGYWKQSLEQPKKVLFLKYEDMQEDGVSEIKKLADFLGCGFSQDEEKKGVVPEILRLCSFENLRSLKVNKEGGFLPMAHLKNNIFFRKGKVGDWVNHFSPSMMERLDQVMRERFAASGLEFKMHP